MIERVLWGVAISCAVTATALRVVPAPTPEAALALVPEPPPLPAVAAVSRGDGIVAANIFTPSRTAPPRRSSPRDAPSPTPPAPAITLFGTTVTADGAFALIEADSRIAGAEIYRVGDLVRGARLLTITDSSVTLASPSGGASRVLRLPPAPALRRSM